jgi:hypothetical protein
MALEVLANDATLENSKRDSIAGGKRLIRQGKAWLAKVWNYAGSDRPDGNGFDSSRLRRSVRHGNVSSPIAFGTSKKVSKPHGWYAEIDHSLILKDTKFVLSNIALFDLLELPENDRLTAMSAYNSIGQNPYGEQANAYARLIVLALRKRYPEGNF